MAFTGWENAKPGEEFSQNEITAFYGSIGPYSLLELPRKSLWGRCPLMAKAIVKNGVPGTFEPGDRVVAFLHREGDHCSVAAFPSAMFKDEAATRNIIARAEMQSLKNSPLGGPWTEQYCARLYVQPYTPSLRTLEPPYAEEDMESVFKRLADEHGLYGDFALASEPYATGAETFANFTFAMARKGADAPDGSRLYAAWDIVLLFFGKAPSHTVIAVPLRVVAFWEQKHIQTVAENLAAPNVP